MNKFVFVFFLLATLPAVAAAQGYEGLVAPQSGYNTGYSAPTTGGYSGVTSWQASPSTYSSSSVPTATDLYSFVGKGTRSSQGAQDRAREDLEARQRARVDEITRMNQERALKLEEEMKQRVEDEQYQQYLLQERARLEAQNERR